MCNINEFYAGLRLPFLERSAFALPSPPPPLTEVGRRRSTQRSSASLSWGILWIVHAPALLTSRSG